MGFVIVIFLILIFCLIVAGASIKVVKQSEVKIIERFGKYSFTAEAGLNILLPFVDKVRAVVSLKQQTMDVTPQSVITKDNVTITIDTVVFYQIMDPVKAVYEIESLQKGIAYIAITTIRDIVGKMDLDATFSSRDAINSQLRDVLDEATDKWGCKVDRVEIKDIKPPADIRDAMEKQMNAERNKRAIILEAEGNAEAIKKVAEAKAEEIKMVYGAIMSSKPDDKLVAIKSLESLEKVANGSANKVFIPFDATKTLGSIAAMSEAAGKKTTK